MISYYVTTARMEVLESVLSGVMVMGDPEGSDSVSTLSWRGLNVH